MTTPRQEQQRRVSGTLAHAIATFGPYDLYVLCISVFAVLVLAADSLLSLSAGAHDVLEFTDTVLCALFLADFVRNLIKSRDRLRYFMRGGWLDLISSIPTIGVLRIGRLVRIARIVRILRAIRSIRTIGQVITRHRKESAIAAAALTTVLLIMFASLAILQFEQTQEANIKSGSDALWWAFATVTTVGYGDRYPVTFEGRVVAAALMAAGVALFGTLSGLVATWFLHGEYKEETDQIADLSGEVAKLRQLLEAKLRPEAPSTSTD